MAFFRGTAMAPRPIQGAGMARPVGGPMRAPQPTEPLNQGGPRLIGSFRRGGRVKKTGAYKLHKGETVLTGAVSRMLRAK